MRVAVAVALHWDGLLLLKLCARMCTTGTTTRLGTCNPGGVVLKPVQSGPGSGGSFAVESPPHYMESYSDGIYSDLAGPAVVSGHQTLVEEVTVAPAMAMAMVAL